MKKHNNLSLVHLILTIIVLLYSTATTAETVTKKTITTVKVRALTDLLVSENSSVPATVVSLNHAILGAQISGKVNKVHVKTGDIVKKNATLVEIDCRDYRLVKKQTQAALESAIAQKSLAAKQYKRNLHLRNIKTIPQNILDESILQTQQVRADISVKKAAIEQSKLAIERCTIKAPYTGQITERLVSVGQLLAPNSPVFKLLQTNALEIKADLTSAEVASAKQATTLVYSRGSVQIPVTFRSVINEVKQGGRTLQARLIPQDSKGLIVGFSGRLEWTGKRTMLPAHYISRRNGRLGVLLYNENKETKAQGRVEFYPLEDASEGQPAFIDLSATTQVIISNSFRLKPNDPVEREKQGK